MASLPAESSSPATAAHHPLPTVQTPVASAIDISVNTRGATLLPEEGSHPDQRDSRAIYLPNHVEAVSHIAVDIGGSLAKLVYFTRAPDEPGASDFQAAARSVNGKGSRDSNYGSSRSLGSDRAITPPLGSSPIASATPFRSVTPVASGTLTPTSIQRTRFFDSHSAAHSGSPFSPTDVKPPPSAGPPKPADPLPMPDTSLAAAAAAAGTFECAGNRVPNSPMARSSSTSSSITPNSDTPMSSLRASFLKRRSLPPVLPGGRLNFVKFETEHIEQCVSFLSELLSLSARANGVTLEEMRRSVKLTATGGGAHMYQELFERELGIEVQREDEMSCLITGLNFITLIPDEVFWLSDELVEQFRGDGQRANFAAEADPEAPLQLPRPSANPPSYHLQFDGSPSPKLPCLLVNIGSGVSIIRVDEFGAFERVSGTSLGGGTLWGLLSLMTGAGSFDEMLALTERGDNGRVDMLVGDIYGQAGYSTLGLKSTTIASSFGKVFRRQSSEDSGDEDHETLPRDRAPGVKSGPSEGEQEESEEQARERRHRERRRKQGAFSSEDICKSLLYAISNNIGQIAYMNAEKYGLDRIYFSGCFIRGHHATINTLSYAIRFWSKGTKRALFLRHEGYLGAVGAWIRQVGGEGSAPIGNPMPGAQAPSSSARSAPTRPEPVRSATSHTSAHGGTPPAPAPAPSPAPAASESQEPTSEKALLANLDKLTPADRALLEPLFQNERDEKAPASGASDAALIASPPSAPASSKPNHAASMAASAQDDWMSLVSGVYAAEQARTRADEALASSRAAPANEPASRVVSGETGQDEVNGGGPREELHGDDEDEDEDEEEDVDEEEMMRRLAAENPELAELLKKMDNANGAADGLERRLDGLLDNLDGLLDRSQQAQITDSKE
ncbi:unnamed protein product [Tilletia controversa]|uniref:Pantothenate kinase n=1 Tax=Tilletia controversa TaxID=13291 RepID=A0A8X7SYA5_9BASI|nr:hypothetical protein CF328_g7865 [Tilletia controversa]KAE8251374.1 hypothetical protein A4X06_0g2712 [Tilletia controversa]CAD6928465.1 unnamed protein product [Tilletia controversa]CAD6982570.1 unnamed protein product [Tilletia controversa]